MPRLGVREWLAVGRAMAHGDVLRTTSRRGAVRAFEAALADHVGARHALTLSSGTAALICGLQALGVGPGDEVLVPAYTWMASAAAVLQVGALPVLVEIDETLTMDPRDLEAKITPRSRAIMPVHMINRPCAMDRILAIAERHGLRVIEDASQAVGIRYGDRACGTLGDVGVFSFNQFKNMTCGEGGALVTDDTALFDRAYCAHDLGMAFRDLEGRADFVPFVGSNFRVSEIEGAILGVQLAKLPGRLRRMARRAARIEAILGEAGLPLAPHAAPGTVMGPALTFDTEAQAVAFAGRRGTWRLHDNSKHVYTNWTAILDRRMAHPRLDPWKWAGAATGPEAGSCPRTLDLLRRSCAVSPGADLPLPIVTAAVRRLARHA